jgi:acetyl-CoA carboxylase carboxyltransferase component
MCGRGYQPDALFAWPTAEISVMGPEGAVNIIFNKQIAAAEDPDAERQKYVQVIREQIDPYVAASWAMVDDVIDPADTRRRIVEAYAAAATKKLERPWRKHGVRPV